MDEGGAQEDTVAELERRERVLHQAAEIMDDTDRPFLDQADALLTTVRDAIGTAYATFSLVNADSYVVKALDVPADVCLEAGEEVPLSDHPECRKVVETEETLVLDDVEADAPDIAESPAATACYLGAPVFAGDGVYGTFCFYDMETRTVEFSDWDVALVTLVSNWISSEVEQLEKEQFYRDAALQMEAAVEAGAVGTWEWNIPDDKMVTGPSFARTFGVDPDAAREGVSLDRFVTAIHEADRERVERKVNEAIESCGEYQAEYRVWDANDDLRWVIAKGHVECDENGTPRTFPGALTDITERKQAEQELESLNERLRTSNERLEQFAHAVSHDLQEPLRMVSSYLQLLADRHGETLDEDAHEYLEFAVDGADRMRQMIDGLLQYSRVGTQGASFEPVDLNNVLADVRTDLRRRIEETDAEITVEELPAVDGDADQLRQLFQNLLENAVRYSGDEPPRIHVSAERDEDERVIAVRDEGIGIAPADQDHIFEVFQRLHGREEYAGTGIGLALCQRIAERHGGSIWVESEPDAGSTFFVALPAA